MTVDYFGTYFTTAGFDFAGLINADFFQPVRILYQKQHYVSATKLLVVAIDSISYIEFGDGHKNTFIKWLNAYADLSALNITPEELWEHRNSLLHMSNLDSNKVISGKARRIIPYIGDLPADIQMPEDNAGYFNLKQLIFAIAHAVGKWANTYEIDRGKIDSFIKRYDLIASDARMLKLEITASPNKR